MFPSGLSGGKTDQNLVSAFSCLAIRGKMGHGYESKPKQKSGGGGAGAAGRIEGRAGADRQHDAGATQGRRAQGGASTVVKNVKKAIECCCLCKSGLAC